MEAKPQLDRRELILRAALRLFRERGFHRTGIDEIGEAAGVTGPAVYRYFSSKHAVLVAVLDAVGDRIAGDARAAESLAPARALERLVASWVELALDDRGLIATWYEEVRNLDAKDAVSLRRRQVGYIDAWISALRGVRPELGAEEARVIVQAAIGAVNSVAHRPSELTRGREAALLRSIAMAALSARP